jgi:hypothetical protein
MAENLRGRGMEECVWAEPKISGRSFLLGIFPRCVYIIGYFAIDYADFEGDSKDFGYMIFTGIVLVKRVRFPVPL